MRFRFLMLAAAFTLLPCALSAQEGNADGNRTIRNPIVPPESQQGVYTTRGVLPWGKVPPAAPLPSPELLKLDEEKPAPRKPADAGSKPDWLKTVPFSKPSSTVSQPLPKGPQMLQAVPVQGVDAIEVTEPAAPSAAPLEANPAEENPETPTEETAPIFATGSIPKPQAIVLRALNKVTGRSELIETNPGGTVRFGKLNITAVTCQTSNADSQLDYAGYFEMNEHTAAGTPPATLFRGWMYATSPSITSLEHPVYDVTMVECVSGQSARAEAKKPEPPEKPDTETSAEDEEVLD